MKPKRIPLTAKWLLALVVVLASLSCNGSGWSKDFPDIRFSKTAEGRDLTQVWSLLVKGTNVDIESFYEADVQANEKEHVTTLMAAGRKGDSAGEKSRVSSSKASQVSLCKMISKMIEDKTIDKYVPEQVGITIGRDPRSSEYLNVDVDGDGISDKVIYSRGSGESLLEIQLSSGGGYDLNENGFTKIVKIKDKIYALVTYWEVEKRSDGLNENIKVGNSLYRLTKHKAVLVCDIKDFKKYR